MTYSYTQISQFLTCPRRYRHRYLDGWKEKEARTAMVFGRAFEQALGGLFSPRRSRSSPVLRVVCLASQANQGIRKELYYFRDQQGLEVDFLVPRPNSNLWLIEAKTGKTVRPSMASPLLSLRRALLRRSGRLVVVHRKSGSQLQTAAIARGVEAVHVERFTQELAGTR